MSGAPEDEPQRLARNINDLLQELRVALAGVQILFGFLLSIVFTDTYRRATDVQHGAHLVAVAFALIAVAQPSSCWPMWYSAIGRPYWPVR
jgi:hypothetical protein